MASVNFIKNIVENKVDEAAHNSFVRFGVGEYEQEPFIVKKTKKNIKIWGSFDYVGVLVPFVLLNTDEEVTLDGGIPALDDLSADLEALGAKDVERKRVFKQKQKMHVFKAAFSPAQAKKFYDGFKDRIFLCNIKSASRQVKIKKVSLPDPRSDTSKFVTVTLPLSDLPAVMSEFLFDCSDKGELTACTINHTYVITDIVVDEKLIAEDPAAARRQAKRKGTLKREIEYNGEKTVKEYEFEV